jgi:hypothetical protein
MRFDSKAAIVVSLMNVVIARVSFSCNNKIYLV